MKRTYFVRVKLPPWINTIFSTPQGKHLPVLDLQQFKEAIASIKSTNKAAKAEKIHHLLSLKGLLKHYQDKVTKRVVLAACENFEYPHEQHTCKKLTGANYDVVLVPAGYFKRKEKKFDVFLLRDHIFLEADLKCITTSNPDTIGKRIKEGSEQSSRIVLDITSPVPKPDLIDGLKTGCEKNAAIIEIMVFYQGRFYCLQKNLVLSRKIFTAIK